MTNQLKRAKREKLKKKQNNVNRNNLRSLHIDTVTPDKHSVSLFSKIPKEMTQTADICGFIASELKQSAETNYEDSIMQAMALTALYILTKETGFKSEILESDLRKTLISISKTENIILAATQGVVHSK
ncbi:hypothetical protein PVE_R2G0869 [Pseudomonas veronii 1YdBTEX2]|uniref:Uncharacterized protein n=2 Tax=Pseudomonas veronii 1YdBTEX2 TaxID=1295141 RepID=A0A1D3K951_PSEVE|nr:hypothetical protein [Pseudomonas veronii]SBW84894.1 hypothetical protein PVE_R2G0869 [Pseudomonas veronii 1YdBTEX2]